MLVFNFIQSNKEETATTDSEQTEDQAGAPSGLPTTHKVADGETLWIISEKYYNSGYNWVDIRDANSLANADDIETGMELTIPAVEPKSAMAEDTGTPTPAQTETTPTPAAAPAPSKEYTVQSGDSLWKIAQATYNDGYRWVEIAQANGLINPDVIHPGNVLKLPQ